MDGCGVYCQLTQDRDAVSLTNAMGRVARSAKNWGGVLVEISAFCCWESIQSGGVWGDEQVVNRGIAVHNRNAERWCVPEQFVSFAGIWIPASQHLLDDLRILTRGLCSCSKSHSFSEAVLYIYTYSTTTARSLFCLKSSLKLPLFVSRLP